MKLKKIYLFDLDGVLIDSKKNMQLSWNELSVKNNINVPFFKLFQPDWPSIHSNFKKVKD